MLQKLDFSNIPNYKYIDEEYKNKNYDPENEYSVPYFWVLSASSTTKR
jgi:spermidine/putrescine transport system substrate-binding protein